MNPATESTAQQSPTTGSSDTGKHDAPDSSEWVQLRPFDEHNRDLRDRVHPVHWPNPTPTRPYHLVVIGAGTAGLVSASVAAGLGARVALVERSLMGGDCLTVGCVPSKGVIRAARVAATVRDSSSVGVQLASPPQFDFGTAMERMRRLRAQISPLDSAERFKSLGVDVYFGQASFIDDETIAVRGDDNRTGELKFRRAVIATGARASAPPIEGLESVDYLTNESVFSLTDLPPRFGIIGSGPIGCEMAQSFARFGSEVFLFERDDQILVREDPDAAAIVQREFERDGIHLMLGSREMKIEPAESQAIRITVSQAGKQQSIVVDKLLVAVGRAPNTDGLNLEAVNVNYDRTGVEVNDFLRTTNPRIYAAGDICSRFKFTHAADFQARIVVQNSLFAIGPLGRRRASALVMPWSTYTSPEIAHVGLYESEAESAGIAVDTYVQPLSEVDRAILEGQDTGFVKVHTKKGTDKIVGATIVAENAGDLISEITVAINNNVGLSGIANSIHPYPTQADALRKVGDQYTRTRLTPLSAKLLNLLRRINVGT